MKKIKVILMGIACCALFTAFACNVYAEENNEIDRLIDEQASYEAGELEKQIDKYAGEGLSEIMEGYDPENLVGRIAKGNIESGVGKIWSRAADILLREIYTNIHLLAGVMVIVVICTILNNLKAAFLNESVGELAFFASYIVLVSVLVISFKEASSLASGIIGEMVDFMYATSPVLVTLLVSGGDIAAAGVIQPIIIMVVEISATIIRNVFIPLVMTATVAAMADNISERIKISRIVELLRKICTWGLGILLTVFAAVIAVNGTVTAVADGVTGKTVKFAIGSIPVVGGYLSDAADTVMGCTLIIKNAAGVAALLGILGICLIPVLKIGSLVLLYRIAGIIAEPVSDKRVCKLFDEIGKSMVHLFAIVVAVAVMFIITITAIIGASNISAMIR